MVKQRHTDIILWGGIWQVMALELGAYKIRVNSISPGIFKSEITEKLVQKAWLNNVVTKIYPLQNLVDSDPALISLARYLIHDSSEYVTGNNFIVDSGATLPGVPIYSSLWIVSIMDSPKIDELSITCI